MAAAGLMREGLRAAPRPGLSRTTTSPIKEAISTSGPLKGGPVSSCAMTVEVATAIANTAESAVIVTIAAGRRTTGVTIIRNSSAPNAKAETARQAAISIQAVANCRISRISRSQVKADAIATAIANLGEISTTITDGEGRAFYRQNGAVRPVIRHRQATRLATIAGSQVAHLVAPTHTAISRISPD